MINYLEKLRPGRLILWGAACFTAAFLIKNPIIFSEAFGRALYICLHKVAPSLFPFLALTNILIESGFTRELGRLLEKPFSFLFALSGPCAAAVVLGMAAGFPVGAKCAVSLFRERQCTKDEAERLLALSTNASPAFLIAAVGVGMFGDAAVGAMLYAVQILSAFIVSATIGQFYRIKRVKINEKAISHPTQNSKARSLKIEFPADSESQSDNGQSAVAIIASSVASAAMSLITICALICFFSIFTQLIGIVFNLSGVWLAICAGFFEITSGLTAASSAGGGLAAAALIIGWSGISVHSQVAAFSSSAGLSMKRYFICKAAQAILFAVIMAAIDMFFII